TMPLTALSFLFCAFSVMGLPPFGGFFSKDMVIAGAIQSGHVAIAAVFIFGALLTILYLFRAFNMVFMGEIKNQSAREGSYLMVSCVVLFAFLSLAGGFFVNYPNQAIHLIVQQMSGMAK
ncbi:MAG: proton-conducting transporter membrane subunit, partial [Candidatus Omnitrophica bacterium]|nr:proton-conducting transporter membrane subunit [Candidatus Omnitrophota bacterium]